MTIGVNAGLISIVTEWLSDLKTGYCYDGWWLNQQFCCWEIEYEDENGCDSWHPWSTAWPAQYMVYIVFAVSLVPHAMRILPLNFASLGDVLFRRSASSEELSQIRCGFWHIGNQMHSCGIYHEGFPWILDMDHQKSYSGNPVLLCVYEVADRPT